jgi:hypothetical protein
LALAASAPAEEGAVLAAIPDTWAAAFDAVRADPPPRRLTRNSHYLVSDEKRHDLFRDDIADRGGVFIGLGPDQNYLMAGWARPEVLVLLDFDQMVVDLHAAYRAAFLEAGTPGEFLRLWSKAGAAGMERLLADEYGENPRFAAIRGAYRRAQKYVAVRLGRVQRSCAKRNVATYLDDPEQYAFVRALFQAGRVFPVRGDLTATMSVRDVAEAARASGLAVRVLYLSNAEQYFPYGDDFRTNMLALPFDERSVVIRTAGMGKKWSADGVYEYVAQSGENFRAWIGDPKTRKVWRMIGAREIDRRTGHSWIRALPSEKP